MSHLTAPLALDLALDILDDLGRAAGTVHRPPTLVRFVDDGADGIEISTKAVSPDQHVAVALRGAIAPTCWQGLGLVGSGWASPVLADGSQGPRRGRARFVELVLRDGRAGSIVARPGVRPHREEGSGAEGRVPDALRRVLGLATPPCSTPPAELWGTAWLARQGLCGSDGGPPSWDDLRSACVAGRWTCRSITPDEASWMDAGMFGREVQRAVADAVAESLLGATAEVAG